MAMVDKHRCWGQRSETNRRIPFTKRPCLPRLCYLDDRRSLQFRSRVKIGIEQNVEGRKEGEVFNLEFSRLDPFDDRLRRLLWRR